MRAPALPATAPRRRQPPPRLQPGHLGQLPSWLAGPRLTETWCRRSCYRSRIDVPTAAAPGPWGSTGRRATCARAPWGGPAPTAARRSALRAARGGEES